MNRNKMIKMLLFVTNCSRVRQNFHKNEQKTTRIGLEKDTDE